MSADIALPEPVEPDAPVIRFVQVECRCGDESRVARDPIQDKQSNEADDWHAHVDATGHRAYYRWNPRTRRRSRVPVLKQMLIDVGGCNGE